MLGLNIERIVDLWSRGRLRAWGIKFLQWAILSQMGALDKDMRNVYKVVEIGQSILEKL